MYNRASVNPAYAGTRATMDFFAHYRAQWGGVDGAPKTASVAMNTPLNNSKWGLGVGFYNDQLGATTENDFSVNLSYAVELNYEYKLAFGLKGSMNLMDVNYGKLYQLDPTDPVIGENISNEFTANIGFGLFLYSYKSYLGFSVPKVFQTDRLKEEEFKLMKQRAHMYVMGGYVFDLNPFLKFKPSFLTKVVSGAPIQVDVNANMMFNDKLTVGAAYRWDASFSALAGFQGSKALFIGYTYDAETTKMKQYSSGTHEVFLRFELFTGKTRMNVPRFF